MVDVVAGSVGILAAIITRFYVKDVDYHLSKEEVKRLEEKGSP